MPEGVTQRVMARYGTVHPHADLDPKRTALIVVDLQNAFMDDAVGHAVCPMARDIVPNVNLNSRLLFTAPADGTYRLVATSFQQRGQGDYTLTITNWKKAGAD